MSESSKHSDFCNSSNRDRDIWRLTSWPGTVRAIFGIQGLLFFLTAFVVLLAPSLWIAVFSISSGRVIFLIPVLFAFLGFLNSSTHPTGIGLIAFILIACVGEGFAIVYHDQLFFNFGILPGITWFGSCSILGVTAQFIMKTLCSSEDLFQMLIQRGLLKDNSINHAPSERTNQSSAN